LARLLQGVLQGVDAPGHLLRRYAEAPREVVQHREAVLDMGLRRTAGQRLDPSEPRPDGAVRDDDERADLPRAVQVRAATQLAAVALGGVPVLRVEAARVAVLDHADAVGVAVLEERDRAAVH